jgi:hypothetical protein
MYGSGIELPKVAFSTITFTEIEPGSFFFGFDLDNSGQLSKIDNFGNITVIEGGVGTVQLTITTSTSFATSDLISGLDQNGRHIIIDNGSSSINITCNGSVTAIYQVAGTGNVTFIAGSGRTLADPLGAIINTQYGTAALSYNGTNDILLVNNV